MSDIPQLVAAIDSRLADIAADIVALDAAKAELVVPRTAGEGSAIATDRTATPSRRRTARRRPTRSPKPSPPASPTGTPKPGGAAQGNGSTATRKRSTTKRAAPVTRPRSGGGAVGAETLERLLADTSAGLSANAIATQTGAAYSRTLKLLRELEAAGQVRRSGSRRSTVWRLITDEERITERAAELERRSSAPRQRRGRARAS
jgi:hypothetical protein